VNNKPPQFLNNKEDIKLWLNEMKIINYIIHDDLTVDVAGAVDLKNKCLKFLPIQFGKIMTNQGNFHIDDNDLTSLLGCPSDVVGTFNCSDNHLTSLEYAPQSCARIFSANNPIQITQALNIKLECFYHQCHDENGKIELFKDLYTVGQKSFFDNTPQFNLEVWQFFFDKRMNEFKEKIAIINESNNLNNLIENRHSHNQKIKL
jgi:hypothetical protein